MIYFVQAGKNGPIKIGCSDDVEKRIAQMQIGCPYELKLLWKIKGDHEDEAMLHAYFSHERVRGEWFHPSRGLLNHINNEACNVSSIWVGNRRVYVAEYVDQFNISITGDEDVGETTLYVLKNEKKLCLEIFDGSSVAILSNGDIRIKEGGEG